jgi:DnaJ-class molecular chaperone
MATLSELLAISAYTHGAVRCGFRRAEKHAEDCVCRGTMRIQACDKCEGSGWDRVQQRTCIGCGGAGAHSASPAAKV